MGPRLRALAAAVPPGAAVADVGCGDGHLARALRERGHRVVATERSAEAAARARARIGDCRVGDGLAAIAPGEVDVAVIAGVGGRTIASILERTPEVVMGLRLLVLQPMQRERELRSWLAGAAFEVVGERPVADRGRTYTVLTVRPR